MDWTELLFAKFSSVILLKMFGISSEISSKIYVEIFLEFLGFLREVQQGISSKVFQWHFPNFFQESHEIFFQNFIQELI